MATSNQEVEAIRRIINNSRIATARGNSETVIAKHLELLRHYRQSPSLQMDIGFKDSILNKTALYIKQLQN